MLSWSTTLTASTRCTSATAPSRSTQVGARGDVGSAPQSWHQLAWVLAASSWQCRLACIIAAPAGTSTIPDACACCHTFIHHRQHCARCRGQHWQLCARGRGRSGPQRARAVHGATATAAAGPGPQPQSLPAVGSTEGPEGGLHHRHRSRYCTLTAAAWS